MWLPKIDIEMSETWQDIIGKGICLKADNRFWISKIEWQGWQGWQWQKWWRGILGLLKKSKQQQRQCFSSEVKGGKSTFAASQEDNFKICAFFSWWWWLCLWQHFSISIHSRAKVRGHGEVVGVGVFEILHWVVERQTWGRLDDRITQRITCAKSSVNI